MAHSTKPARDLPHIRGPADFAAAFGASPETLARLEAYAALLRQWQKAVNLVAPSTLDAVWHRHFADSAQLLPLAPPNFETWIDLGSGAGFPGLVIAILLAESPPPHLGQGGAVPPARGEGQPHRPAALEAAPHSDALPTEEWGEGMRVMLVESDTRKCAFLREVVRQAALGPRVAVDILSTRAESVTIQVNLALPRVVSARALAPLPKLLALAAPLSPPSTVGLFLKGKDAAKELQAAEKSWNFNAELVPSVTDKDARIIVIGQLERKAKD